MPAAVAQCTESDARQASEGDVTAEKPMWTDRGGVDFSGQLAWQAWTELKVRWRGRRSRATQAKSQA